MRTDDNRNPSAFITDLARQAGLILGVDYEMGTSFPAPSRLVTAKLLGDPIEITIHLITKVGYYAKNGAPRWDYIAMPSSLWRSLTYDQQRDVVGFHYLHEGGTTMRHLFPNYGDT